MAETTSSFSIEESITSSLFKNLENGNTKAFAIVLMIFVVDACLCCLIIGCSYYSIKISNSRRQALMQRINEIAEENRLNMAQERRIREEPNIFLANLLMPPDDLSTERVHEMIIANNIVSGIPIILPHIESLTYDSNGVENGSPSAPFFHEL